MPALPTPTPSLRLINGRPFIAVDDARNLGLTRSLAFRAVRAGRIDRVLVRRRAYLDVEHVAREVAEAAA